MSLAERGDEPTERVMVAARNAALPDNGLRHRPSDHYPPRRELSPAGKVKVNVVFEEPDECVQAQSHTFQFSKVPAMLSCDSVSPLELRTVMPAEQSSISIRIEPGPEGSYKSVENLEWSNIPGFAVLTGKNGSGKTQLLEIIAYYFSGALPPASQRSGRLPVNIVVEGAFYEPHEVGYLPSVGRFSGGAHASISELSGVRQRVLDYARQSHAYRHDIVQTIKAQKGLKRLSGHNPHSMTQEEIEAALPDDLEFAIDDIDVTEGLTHVFMAHRFKVLEAIERGVPGFDKDGRPLGVPPWQVVNESLAAAGFPYEVISPVKTPITGHYGLRLIDTVTNKVIDAVDLSSGEKVILQLVLWLFTAGKDGLFPKILILDEPDAHLHPSMTVQFLDVLVEVLVNRYGVRVLMTTHSPSTVALAPEGSIFRLDRGATEVTPASREEMISILTAGLITVSRNSKFCFVEDVGDVAFYEAVYEILSDYGPSRDPMALRAGVPIAFIAASIGSGSSRTAGGSAVVKKWVEKLDAEPLRSTFLGITDRDLTNTPTDRILVLGRYSFENYLLDPLVLFALLLENGSAPALPGLDITQGDEHRLRSLQADDLQKISDAICGSIEASETSLSGGDRKQVLLTSGKALEVPAWVINHRGHDLLPIVQRAFGGPSLVNPVRLLKAFRRARLIPTELASLLSAVQAA